MDFSLIRSHVSWCGRARLIMMRPLLRRGREGAGDAGSREKREMSGGREVEGRAGRDRAGRRYDCAQGEKAKKCPGPEV